MILATAVATESLRYQEARGVQVPLKWMGSRVIMQGKTMHQLWTFLLVTLMLLARQMVGTNHLETGQISLILMMPLQVHRPWMKILKKKEKVTSIAYLGMRKVMIYFWRTRETIFVRKWNI